MKKNLLLVLAIVLVVAFSLVLTVACDKTKHTHDFGDAYTITVEPTETTKGKATHKCECGDIDLFRASLSLGLLHQEALKRRLWRALDKEPLVSDCRYQQLPSPNKL